MEWFWELKRRLAIVLRWHRVESEMDEEMRLHLELLAEENRRSGMDAAEALSAARRRFGIPTLIRERSRDAWGWTFFDRLRQDLRYGGRTMVRNPGIAAAAIISLALGIGASTALFGVMDGLWFRPLAVHDPSGLVRIFDQKNHEGISFGDYRDMAESAKTLSGLAASHRRGPFMRIGETTVPTLAEVVSDNYFTVLGVEAALGRVFHQQSPMPREVVLSHRLWRQRFGSDESVIGRHVVVDGKPYRVSGVAPTEFRGIEPSSDVDIWLPHRVWDPSELFSRTDTSQDVFGRLADGFNIEQARTELGLIANNLANAHPATNKGRSAYVISALQYRIESAGDQARIIAAIAIMLLLIACANVANLLLARGESRRRELAIRTTVGCGRRRLIRQLLTESLLLAAFGGAVALVLAKWLISLFPRIVPLEGVIIRLDGRALAFSLLATTATALVFGLLPAFRVTRPELTRELKQEPLVRKPRFCSVRDALVVAQMALSLVLLACAGLLTRSFMNCLRLDLGFERNNIIIARLCPALPRSEAHTYFAQALAKVQKLAGVQQAGLVRRTPLWPSEGGFALPVRIPGHPSESSVKPLVVKFNTAGDHYFKVMGIRLLLGRDFTPQDDARGVQVAIINQTMARTFWPGQDPIGRIVVAEEARTARQVVGVVNDTRINGIVETPEPYIYLPLAQDSTHTMSLVVRGAGDLERLTGAIRAELAKLDPMPPEFGVMDALIRSSIVDRSAMAYVAGGLSLTGLLLTAAGLFGVMSFLVARRAREIGIRVALGARRSNTVGLVLGRALLMAAIGAAVGIAGALALSGVLRTLLFGVLPYDPSTLAGVCILLLAMASAATLQPAVRASLIDPVATLKAE